MIEDAHKKGYETTCNIMAISQTQESDLKVALDMLGKMIVYSSTREEAIRKMRRCLEEFTLEGFPTNAELSYQILYHPEFILGECTTAFLDEHLSELLEFSRKLSESGVDA